VVVVVFWLTGAAESLWTYLDPELLESMTDAEVIERLPPLLWAVAAWSILQLVAVVFVFFSRGHQDRAG
jgi:choline-glycine betaine transporter